MDTDQIIASDCNSSY